MKRETKLYIVKIILSIIAAGGIITLAAAMPGAVQAVDLFWGKDKRKYSSKYYVKKKITDLEKQGLIKFEDKNGKTFIRLTEKGKQRLLKYRLQEIKIKKPKKWDKKWRVVIFDIKEYKRFVRDGLREELINLGFLKLQNSVWVYPYECEEVIIMLKSHFKTGKEVLYMTVDNIENDRWLKKEFNL
jgi:DNA-binding transcriptional regulator PaaX